MKYSPKKLSPRALLFSIVGVILLLVAGAGVYVYGLHKDIFGWPYHPSSSGSSINNGPATKAQIDAGNQAKQNSINNTNSSSATSKGSDTTNPTSPQQTQSTSSTVDMSITSTNQTASTLQIRTIIYSVQSTGNCVLTLTKSGSASVMQTAGIQTLASSTSCKGFDIPLSQLSKGAWTANVTFNNDNINGSASQVVNIN